jgi:hypothetical protein
MKKMMLVVVILATMIWARPTSAQGVQCFRTHEYPAQFWDRIGALVAHPSSWPGAQIWLMAGSNASRLDWRANDDPRLPNRFEIISITVDAVQVQTLTINTIRAGFVLESRAVSSISAATTINFARRDQIDRIEITVSDVNVNSRFAVGYICVRFIEPTLTPLPSATPTQTLAPTATPSPLPSATPSITPTGTLTPSAEPTSVPSSTADTSLAPSPKPFDTKCLDIKNPCRFFPKIEFPRLDVASLTPIQNAPYTIPTGLPSSTSRAAVGLTPGATGVAIARELGALGTLAPGEDTAELRQDIYEIGRGAGDFFAIARGLLSADLGPASAPLLLLLFLIIINISIRLFTFLMPVVINVAKFVFDVITKILDLIIPL